MYEVCMIVTVLTKKIDWNNACPEEDVLKDED